MKNSLTELKGNAIAVGTCIITGIVNKESKTYSCLDTLNKTVFFIQAPKSYDLVIGKLYSVLGRISSIKLNNKNHLLVYCYKIYKKRILAEKGFKLYFPIENINSLATAEDSPKSVFKKFNYLEILISNKETEVVELDLLGDIKVSNILKEFTGGITEYDQHYLLGTLADKDNPLYLNPITVSWNGLSWMNKKFYLENK